MVEDQPELRRLAVRQLAPLGLKIIEEADGLGALDALEEFGPRIRLAVVDWTLPRLGGAELLMRLADEHPDLPILLCSGYALGPREAPWTNVKGFLTKPYAKADLIDLVQSLWAASTRRTSLGSPLPQAVITARQGNLTPEEPGDAPQPRAEQRKEHTDS